MYYLSLFAMYVRASNNSLSSNNGMVPHSFSINEHREINTGAVQWIGQKGAFNNDRAARDGTLHNAPHVCRIDLLLTKIDLSSMSDPSVMFIYLLQMLEKFILILMLRKLLHNGRNYSYPSEKFWPTVPRHSAIRRLPRVVADLFLE